MRRLTGLLSIGVFFASAYASAGTIHVPADQPTIQAGINTAASGDTVLVAPGEYEEHLTLGSVDLVLASSSGPSMTAIVGDGQQVPLLRIPNAVSNATKVTGFTFRSGVALGGGAIDIANGAAIIKGNVFYNNLAQSGGAIRVFPQGTPHIIENVFDSNRAIEGGGAIVLLGGSTRVEGNLFIDNRTNGHAGAVHTSFCRAVFVRNVFVRNTSPGVGNAIAMSSGSRDSVINNTFFGSPSGGGTLGIWYCDSAVVLNNIFAFNQAPAIRQEGASVFATNYNDVYPPLDAYAGVLPGPNDKQSDPRFVDTVAGNPGSFRLRPTSPCIDAGHPSAAFNDPDGSRNDMGAFALSDSLSPEDGDGDGIPDSLDLCPAVYDPSQIDVDGDGVGDACDICPGDFNPAQIDSDNDGFGDGCDVCVLDPANDADGDGDCANEDNCPQHANADQSDMDGDGRGDVCDNCASTYNPDQSDMDGDSKADVCDNCPTIYNTRQYDSDYDGIGDACDPCLFDHLNDPDSDNVCNRFDNCPTVVNTDQADTNGNGVGDVCECICVCHGNPNCDGAAGDVFDVISTVNIAFRGESTIPDPGEFCTRETTDLDCSGATDIIDVVKVVNVAFRGANVATEYCAPCQ